MWGEKGTHLGVTKPGFLSRPFPLFVFNSQLFSLTKPQFFPSAAENDKTYPTCPACLGGRIKQEDALKGFWKLRDGLHRSAGQWWQVLLLSVPQSLWFAMLPLKIQLCFCHRNVSAKQELLLFSDRRTNHLKHHLFKASQALSHWLLGRWALAPPGSNLHLLSRTAFSPAIEGLCSVYCIYLLD